MATSELSTGKTIFVLTVVAGCFAVLWPKIFYPMFFGSPQYLNNLEKAQGIPLPHADSAGCCDVIFEKDIETLKILTQLCEESVLGVNPNQRLSQSALLTLCYRHLQETCNIDLSQVFKMNARHEFDSSFKEFLNVVRSYNSSLCLKDHYYVNFNLIGTPHIIKSAVMKPTSLINLKNERGVMQSQMRQERPPHLRPEILHPALRENGRVIPHEHSAPRVEQQPPPRPVVKAGVPKPGMAGRPSFGGAGAHQGGKQGGGIMTLLMPMYTVSIVAFFIYTMLRIWDPVVLFVKLVLQFVSSSSNNARQNSVATPREYYTESTTEFRSSYYDESLPYSVAGPGKRQIEDGKSADKGGKKLVVSAISGLLEQVNREILESAPEIGPRPLSDPSQDGVQTDKMRDSPISAESKTTLSEVPPSPPPQVNSTSSSLFPSRQSSVLEVEVRDYEDVKQVFEKQRHHGGETQVDGEASKKSEAIAETIDRSEKNETDEKQECKEVIEGVKDEVEDKIIARTEYAVKDKQTTKEVKELSWQKEVYEAIVDEKEEELPERDLGFRSDVTTDGSERVTQEVGKELGLSEDKIKTPEELIKENIAKISEELNKTIIGESTEYEVDRNGPKLDEGKVSVVNGHGNEKTRSDDFGLDSEDVSDSSTLHEEKSEGSPTSADVSRSSTIGHEAKPVDEEPFDARAVQVVTMERTESLVGGQKYAPPLPDAPPTPYAPGVASRPLTPDVPAPVQPHRIILDGLLPESSQILVADELTETESITTEDGESDSDSVVLSSKVTLSLIPAGGDREEQVDGRSRGEEEGVKGETNATISGLTRASTLLLRETNGASATQKHLTEREDDAETDAELDSEEDLDEPGDALSKAAKLVGSHGNQSNKVISSHGDRTSKHFGSHGNQSSKLFGSHGNQSSKLFGSHDNETNGDKQKVQTYPNEDVNEEDEAWETRSTRNGSRGQSKQNRSDVHVSRDIDSDGEELDELNEAVDEMKRGVHDLNEGVGDMNEGVNEMKRGVHDLNEGVGDLNEGVDDLNEGVDDLNEGVNDLNEEEDVLNEGVVEESDEDGEEKEESEEEDGGVEIEEYENEEEELEEEDVEYEEEEYEEEEEEEEDDTEVVGNKKLK